MPKIIAVEGQGNLQFGDDWSDEQIDQYIEDKYFGGQSSAQSQAIPAAEKQGVWDSFTSGFGRGFEAGGIPFYSGGKEAVKSVGVLSAALAAREGAASDEQMQRLREYKAEEDKAAAEAEGRGSLERIAYGVGRVLGEAPGFAGELALTGGIATAGEKAAVKAAATAVKALGKETAYTATRKAADWAADKVSGRIVRGAAGAAAQTIPSGAARIVSGTAERMTPGFELEEAPGGTYFTETKQADPFVTAAYKALGDQFIEVLSERSGGFLTDMLGAGARKAGLGSTIDWASGLKKAVAGRVAQKYPGMFEGNNFIDAIGKTTKWDGVFGEMLEERAGEVGRAALGVQDYQAPSMEQLATEALGFGLIDAGFNGARLAAALSKKNLSKDQRARTQQALDAVTAAEIITPQTDLVENQEPISGDVAGSTVAITPSGRIIRTNSAKRRAELEAGLFLQQDSGQVIDDQEVADEQRVGQYPPEGFGTGVIPSAEEQQRRAAVRARVASRNREAANAARLQAMAAEEQAQREADAAAAAAVPQSRESAADQLNAVTSLLADQEALVNQPQSRFGPGARGEVPQTIRDAGTDVMAKLRALQQRDRELNAQIEAEIAARAEAKRLAAEKAAQEQAAREQAAAQARAAAEKAAQEKAAAEAAAAEAAAAATPTSLPTESSLPVGTGAAPVGGVPVAAPVVSSNGTQIQAPPTAAVAPVQPTKTETPSGPAGSQTTAPQGPVAAPKYSDGTEVKAGDTIRWRTAAGKNEVLGTIDSIKDGVPQVRVTQLSKKAPNTQKIGNIELSGVYPVINFNLLEKREPVKEEEKKKIGRPSKITQTDDENVAAILEEGVNHPMWPRFSELMRGALNENEADEEALDALREQVGTRASVAMEAAFNQQTAFDFIDGQQSVVNVEIDDVLTNYDRGLKKWVLKNIDSKSPIGFSPKKNLLWAVRNSRKKSLVEKKTTSMSSSVDEDGEESSPIEQFAQPVQKESAASMASIFRNVEALADAVVPAIQKAEAAVRGRQLTPTEFTNAVISGFKSLIYNAPASVTEALRREGTTPEKIAETLGSVGLTASGNLQDIYDEKGIDGVEAAIVEGEALLANAATQDTGNQSLQQGEITLADAINTVLAGNTASSWMRGIAEKLLKANLRARVVVLSDAEFDRVAPRPGQAAFYDSNPQSDTIYIRQSAASHDYLVMHEAVHAATVYALRTNVSFRNEVRRLRDAAVNALGANSFYGLQEHGSNFNNLAEFVGESMSSQEFRDALNGVVDKDGQSLWTKFLNLIGRLFGFKGEQKTLLNQIVNLSTEQFAPNVAISEGDQGVGELMSAPQIESAEQLNDLTSVPGLNAANIAAIENLAATQAQMVPGSIVSQIATLPTTVRRSLNWLVEQAAASPSPKALSSMPTATEEDVQAKHEAAHAVDKLARDIENERAKVLDRLETVRQKYAASINGLKAKLSSANAEVAATTGVVDNLVDDYTDYVRETVLTGGTLTVAQKAAYNQAAEIVRRTHKQSDQMRKAIAAIAEGVTDAELNAAQTNDDIVNIITTRKMLDGKVLPETINTLFTAGSSGKTPLQSMRRLIPALKMIKKINSNIAGVKASIDGFEKAVAGMTGNKQRKVNPRAFARLYRRVLAKQSKAIEEARLLDNSIDRMERKILRAVQEVDIYDNLIASPEFTAQHEEAIRNLNILSSNAGETGGAEGATSDRKVTYKIGSQLFTLEYSADPAVNANNNAVVMGALAAIENELKKPLSPIDRYKLKWMRAKLTLFSNPMGDAALAINSFDIINRLRVAIPILTPLIDRAFVYSMMPGSVGKELRLLLKVSMSVGSGIEAARMHPRHGEDAINLAVDNAIKSHPGLDPRIWDKEVLNEFLGSNQERTGRNLKVGDTTAFGHVITKEDVKAAELQARFADAVYKAARGSENGGIAMYYPTLVAESFIVNGEKRTRFRYAYAGGAFTTPMTLDRSELPGSLREMSKKWHNEKDSPSTAYANRLALLQQSKWFVNMALKHVMEMSPLYKRKSPYTKIYQTLADRYASTGQLPGTLDDLVNDIDAMNPSVGDEVLRKDEITRQLVSEITEFVDSYLTELEGVNRDEQTALLKKDSLSADAFNAVISGSNNFTKPRGEMVAPSNFYNFTVSSDSAKGVLTHAAMMPIRMRQLALMQEARKAFESELLRMKEEIRLNKKTGGYLKGRWQEPKSNVMSGKSFLNYGQLSDLVKMIDNSFDVFKQTLEKPAVGRLQTSVIEDMLQIRRVMLVAQLTSAIMNFTQAVTAGQFTPRIYLQGYKPKSLIKQGLTQIVRGAWDTAAVLASENKAVSGWLKANKSKTKFLMRKFAEQVEEFQRLQARSINEGFAAPRIGVFERANIVRQIGTYGSPVEGFADTKGFTSEALESVFSKWFLPHIALAIQNIPASVDRVANLINLMAIQDTMNLVMRSGISIMEKRAASGATGWDNWSDPKNLISDAEADAAGWQRETLVNMRQAFSGLGGLERVLHDYWLRVQAAKAAGTDINDVPPIADEGFYRDVSRELLGMTNASMEGMRAESIKGRTVLGRIYNFIFTFSSWVNRYFSTLGNMSAIDPKRGYVNFAAHSAISMALLLTVLALSGAWNNEIRGFFYELVKGRPYPVTRLGDVLRDTTAGSVAKLAAASIGLMVPYAGESIANLVGGQNYRNSPTDIASFSQTVQLAKTFSSAIESGMKTGDWTGTFVNTLRQTVPGTDAVLNRLPGVRASDASADAGRAARVAAGPLELSDKGGQGGTPTKFSNLVRRAEAAAAGGNLEEARSLLEQAAEEKKKTGGTDPYGAVKSAIAGRSVDRKTFGRKLTDDEREGLLSRMSDGQRAAYQKAEDANKALAGLVPESGSRGEYERVGGKPKTAIDRMNSKFRKIRRSATPKALRAINKKIKSLKPKKLKISKPKNVSGSRLLRPKARGAGASVLRPASM
jgi:hypothetical protein